VWDLYRDWEEEKSYGPTLSQNVICIVFSVENVVTIV